MKIISNLLKEHKDEWLVQTTASINEVNPIVDRIMEDETVEVVVMANNEGNHGLSEALIELRESSSAAQNAYYIHIASGLPILTNVNVLGATLYATAMHCLGTVVQNTIKEMDPFDETLVFRMKTRKEEMMVAPHREFSIVIVQHGRPTKEKNKKKRDNTNAEN